MTTTLPKISMHRTKHDENKFIYDMQQRMIPSKFNEFITSH